jgi:hypothetical protein
VGSLRGHLDKYGPSEKKIADVLIPRARTCKMRTSGLRVKEIEIDNEQLTKRRCQGPQGTYTTGSSRASFRMSKNESELTGWFLRGRGPALSKITAIQRDSARFSAIQRDSARFSAIQRDSARFSAIQRELVQIGTQWMRGKVTIPAYRKVHKRIPSDPRAGCGEVWCGDESTPGCWRWRHACQRF